MVDFRVGEAVQGVALVVDQGGGVVLSAQCFFWVDPLGRLPLAVLKQ